MSMLAERRRKTKWIIHPSRKPLWTSDTGDVKFGKELMEKMGWAPGKGLGLKEQGMQEPLKVSHKNNTKGLGFKGNDEDWIEQQDEFNSLLNELSNSNSDSIVKLTEAEKNEIKSLEEKSKKSRARVHYHKFTRGKDLSRYSENDLACILGTNKTKKDKTTTEDKVENDKNTPDGYETSFGVTTINSGSIQDYFKKKFTLSNNISGNLANIFNDKTQNNTPTPEDNVELEPEDKKSRKRKLSSEIILENSGCVEPNERELDLNKLDEEIKKHKKKKRKDVFQDLNSGEVEKKKTDSDDNKDYDNIVNELTVEKENSSDKDLKKKSKKSKKDKDDLDEGEEFLVEKKKKKKNKESHMEKNVESNDPVSETTENCNGESEQKIVKIKKKKKRDMDDSQDVEIEAHGESPLKVVEVCEGEEDAKTVPVKKKKKKRDLDNSRDIEIETDDSPLKVVDVCGGEEDGEAVSVKKKKKKRDLHDSGGVETNDSPLKVVEVCEGEEDGEAVSVKKKKKKRDLGNSRDIEIETNDSPLKVVEVSEEVLVKKKKKKKDKKEKSDAVEDEKMETEPEINTEHISKKKKTKKHKKEKSDREENVEGSSSGKRDSDRSPCNDTEVAEVRKDSKPAEPDADGVIHSHKPELFKAKLRQFSTNYTNDRVVKLVYGAEIDKFKGSNLKNVMGYGVHKENGINRRDR